MFDMYITTHGVNKLEKLPLVIYVSDGIHSLSVELHCFVPRVARYFKIVLCSCLP